MAIITIKKWAKLSMTAKALRLIPGLFRIVAFIDAFWDTAKHESKEDDSIFTKISDKFLVFKSW